MGEPKIYMKDKEAAKDVTELSKIGVPGDDFIRVVTLAHKIYESGSRDVYEITDFEITCKDGRRNPVVDRYIRKWQAKLKNYADSNIVKILYPAKFKHPEFSDQMLRTGSVEKKTPEASAMEKLAAEIGKLVAKKA